MKQIRNRIREEVLYITISKNGIFLGKNNIVLFFQPFCWRTNRLHGHIVAQYYTGTMYMYNLVGKFERSYSHYINTRIYNIRMWLVKLMRINIGRC